jgi:hypothetical protein
MRRSVRMLAAALLLAPLMAAQAGPVVVEVAYLGQGHYSFKKDVYDYAGVVQAIRAAHQDEHIDLVAVYIPGPLSAIDRRDICRLKQDLGTQLKMHLDIGNGETREQFCN